MIESVVIYQKENGFAVVGVDDAPSVDDKELVVEGKDPKKIGAAVLALFQKPRTPRKKKEVSA